MDAYTQKTQLWLDQRFKQVDQEGIYFAHQPIYGFRAGHSELGLGVRYIRTYQILKSLCHIQFSTALDVGGAEGYKAYLLQQLFGATVTSTDLSNEANKRAAEIFHVESKTVDIHELPYGNESFDVAVSSETIEHVTDYKKAVSELLRVAKKAVVITVPHETEDEGQSDEPHGHINQFDLHTFDYLKALGYSITAKKMISTLLYYPTFLCEGQTIPLPEEVPSHLLQYMPITYQQQIEKIRPIVGIHNAVIAPIARAVITKSIFAKLIELDEAVCKLTPWYHAIIYTIVKDSTAVIKPEKTLPAKAVLDISVPFHYLKQA